MASDHVGSAGDHHLMDITADQNLAMPVGGRDRVVIAAVANQRQRTHPGGALVAGIIGDRRQILETGKILRQSLADRS